MKKILVMASVMMLGVSGAWALGTDAGTNISNYATLSYEAGGVAQPDKNSTTDTFVVDKKIDMILITNNSEHLEVTPGQQDKERNFHFTNEGNADQNFTFTAYNLDSGEKADYNTTADNTDSSHGVQNIEIKCTDDGGTVTGWSGSFTIDVPEDGNLTCLVRSDIRTAADGGADGQVMVIELNATAVDSSGNKENETSGADHQGQQDTVFADGAADQTHSTSTLGNSGGGNGDTARDGIDVARSGYIIKTPILSATKNSCVVSDPVNNTTNPKRIPGAIIRYMFDIDNTGTGDVNDLNITDTISNDLLTTRTKASAKKDENQASCACGTEPGTDISGDTTVTGQNLLIEKVDVAHGSTTGSSGHNHTCVSVEVEIK